MPGHLEWIKCLVIWSDIVPGHLYGYSVWLFGLGIVPGHLEWI